MLREWYTHPNGQIPAYEWDFGDVNPPVLSMAAQAVFEIERQHCGVADYTFLERVFQKMLLNFTWWVNRKDALGKNIFQGGFLGMDNIGAFDRDNLPPGYLLGQADGTSWMAAFAKNMLSIALILAETRSCLRRSRQQILGTLHLHRLSMNNPTDSSMSLWDEQDGFFYDYLYSDQATRLPGARAGPWWDLCLCLAAAQSSRYFARYPGFQRRRQWFIEHRPDLVASIGPGSSPGRQQSPARICSRGSIAANIDIHAG